MYSGIKPHALTLFKTNVRGESKLCVSVLQFCIMILMVTKQLKSFRKEITSTDMLLAVEGATC